MSVVLNKVFSKKRIQKAIDKLEQDQIVDFSHFNSGGAPRQTSAFLKSCNDVEYLGKGNWRKL